MILHSYVEQVMTMCHIQEWQLSLSYFLSYFPLMVSAAISAFGRGFAISSDGYFFFFFISIITVRIKH